MIKLHEKKGNKGPYGKSTEAILPFNLFRLLYKLNFQKKVEFDQEMAI